MKIVETAGRKFIDAVKSSKQRRNCTFEEVCFMCKKTKEKSLLVSIKTKGRSQVRHLKKTILVTLP